jgi:hypothetical protein
VNEAANDDLVVAVARELVARTAPQELPLFRATSAAYLDDPERVLRSKAGKDEVLGFAVEGAVLFLTPVALEVAKTVVSFLVTQIRGALEKESSDTIATRVHALFHPAPGAAGAEKGESSQSPPLTQEQLRRVHDLALEKARAFELPETQAGLLADAVVGSLAVT